MSRRRPLAADSLELLLDTICNTFGGVLFIAILVVILLQLSGDAPDSTPDAHAVSTPELQRLTEELKLLTQQQIRLQQLVENQQGTLSAMAPAAFQNLLKEKQQLQQTAERLQAENQTARARLARQQAVQASQVHDLQVAATSVKQAQADILTLEEELKHEQEARKSELRTSILSSPGIKREVVLVLEYQRLYVWHRFGSLGTRDGLNTNDFLILSDDGDTLVTSPNPQGGIPVDGGQSSRARLLARLREFNPSLNYLVVVARPDSYGSFEPVRDAMVEAGFQYRLVPSEAGEEYVDRGGKGGRVQ